MAFFGILLNFAVVLVAGALGSLFKRGLPKHLSDAIIGACGVCVLYIGLDGILAPAPAVGEGSFLSAGLVKVLIMILSMALGTLIGELLDIDRAMTRLGDYVEKKMTGGKEGTVNGHLSRGFVACSLLFCIGAMSVNGSIADVLEPPLRDHSVLIAKSVIDGITCFVMATTFGIGCALSAFTLLVYQGGIGLIAYFLQSFLPTASIEYMSITGSLIILLLGTNMLGMTKIKTANLIPAMFLPLLLAPLFGLFC